MREWPDSRNIAITSASELSMSIASMSARGIMTSSTRMSPSFRMARSMVRSSAVSVCARRLVGSDRVLDVGACRAVLADAERAEKRRPEPRDYVRLLARAFGRRALGTSTLVVAHCLGGAA